MTYLYEILNPLQVLFGIITIGLGVILFKCNGDKDVYINSMNREAYVICFLLGILFLFGYLNVDEFIKQFIDKFNELIDKF